MACLPLPDDDREGAVREVAQVYERIKIHQPLLLLLDGGSPSTAAQQLAQSLLGEALRALNVALSVMKQPAAAPATLAGVKAEPPHQLSSPGGLAAGGGGGDYGGDMSTARSAKRRRTLMEGKSSSSWVHLTAVPHEDGYEWRKYGEKRINGTDFTRNYFRCTYRDDRGCQATKHVQQKDSNDPPMFIVTYNNDHTCNCNTTTAAANSSHNNKQLLPSLGGRRHRGSEGTINNPPNYGHADSAMIKQEEPLVLPSLVHVSADPLNGQKKLLCQKPCPITSPICGAASASSVQPAASIPPSTTSTPDSSCISGVSCYEHYSGDMAAMAAESVGDDDTLHDLELFLLYDSFKYY
ncbi:hypothetical protein ACP4OV_003348 [Aristida adscensionis]